MQYIKIDDYGDKFYYKDEEFKILHREDGAAVEWANGTKEWWLNGKLHREDGPAYEGENGTKEWWINGEEFSEAMFNLKMHKYESLESVINTFIEANIKPKNYMELTVAQIEKLLGYKVKIVK